jgi:GntR family transcriptional regulator/MocR family aminotransferase
MTASSSARAAFGASMPHLDAASSEPLYRQVRAHIADAIASGVFDAPGRALPSSRHLATEFGISRNTVELAYQELIAQGIVESRPRSGLYATDRLPRRTTTKAPPTGPATTMDWGRRTRCRPQDDLPHAAKVVDWHEYPYPFVGGQIDADTFPVKAWLRALGEAHEPPHLHYSLRDSLDRDDPLLLEAICVEVLRARGITADPSQILITSGAQQGLFLVAQALLDRSSVVGVENPGYLDAWHIFSRAGATLMPMPVDQFGASIPAAPPRLDIAYVTPGHQHPTNVTMHPARRRELLELAERTDAVIIEDDYDSEFRFSGRPTRPLKAMESAGRVIYLGTFSKFLAPGLRLGFIVADAELIDILRDQRRYLIRHPPGQLQRALALFIMQGEYHRQLRRLRTQFKQKWDIAWANADRHLPWPVGTGPTGGLSLWLTGPARLDAAVLARRAAKHGVLVEAGEGFFLGPHRTRNNVRLGFTSINERAIPRGIEILGGVARTLLAERPD